MRVLALLLGIVLAVVIAVWLIGGVTATSATESIGNEQWPAGLGTLASVEGRVPPHPTNEAARQLTALAAPLQISFESTPGKDGNAATKTAFGEYLKAQQVRSEATIEAPPPLVSAFLAEHEAAIDVLRDHLLHGGPIAWEVDASKGETAPLPSLLAHMHITRLLTTRALDRGRVNDVRAWDDLHAVWRLTESLTTRPELISQLIAMAMSRSINAASWKLPPASAPWLADLYKVDHRRLLLAAVQYDTWNMWRLGEGEAKSFQAALAKPYFRWSMLGIARHQRDSAAQIAAMTTCDFDGPAFYEQRMQAIPRWNHLAQMALPNLGVALDRSFRVVAEREAAVNAMRIAQGQPIIATSGCSDGTWTYANGRLSFSRDIRPSSSADQAMPLSLAIPARATRQST
jgi:hypothetical protein